MADQKTPQEKANDAVLTRMLTLQGIAASPEIAKAEAEITVRRTAQSVKARHAATMTDYASGDALDRALAAFKVRVTVADAAKSLGRDMSGKVPQVKLPPVSGDLPSDVEGDAATA